MPVKKVSKKGTRVNWKHAAEHWQERYHDAESRLAKASCDLQESLNGEAQLLMEALECRQKAGDNFKRAETAESECNALRRQVDELSTEKAAVEKHNAALLAEREQWTKPTVRFDVDRAWTNYTGQLPPIELPEGVMPKAANVIYKTAKPYCGLGRWCPFCAMTRFVSWLGGVFA